MVIVSFHSFHFDLTESGLFYNNTGIPQPKLYPVMHRKESKDPTAAEPSEKEPANAITVPSRPLHPYTSFDHESCVRRVRSSRTEGQGGMIAWCHTEFFMQSNALAAWR
jgi:hypothetical protein